MKNVDAPNLILYGGGFDPPHQGHVDVVRETMDVFPEAEILIAPDRQPAGASGRHKVPVVGFETRIKLCEIAFSELRNSRRVTVSSLAGSLPTPNYTLSMLERLQGLQPKIRLGLLIGQDQMASFPQWHKPREVLQAATLIVHQRAPHHQDTVAEAPDQIVADALAKLGLHLDWIKPHQCASIAALHTNIYVIRQAISPATSAHIRDVLSESGTLPKGWLPAAVLSYIKEKRLYGL